MMPLIVLLITSIVSSANSLKAKIDAAEKAITEMNRDLSCTTDDDCIALAFGYRICGGPNAYLMASKKNPKLALLKKEIDKHRELEKKRSQEEGLASICSIEEEPSPRCLNQICTATKAGQ